MRINIAASHRFHLLDLARELAALGHDVSFYSYVPRRRCMAYGLPRSCVRSFTWLALPFLALGKLLGDSYGLLFIRNWLIDHYVAWFMRPCDVFIGLGGIYNQSFAVAKRRFNAIVIDDWGSNYITEEIKYFDRKYPRSFLRRDLNGYNIADYIAIPSLFVLNNFLRHDIQRKKLFVDPYGVSFSQFHPTELQGDYDLIFVGGWRKRKGCHILVELCQRYHYKLLHVGALVDLPFPEEGNFIHVDAVDQRRLVDYYAKAKVFVFPSLSDGFGMVLSQALACGLPIVCSSNSGGTDLKSLINHPEYIIIMPDYSIETLHQCVEEALAIAQSQSGVRDYAGDVASKLSWAAYGKRYSHFLEQKLKSSMTRVQ